MRQVTCQYCQTLNPDISSECIVCGAPLEVIISQPQSFIEPIQTLPPETSEDYSIEQIQEVLNTASSTYSLALRTLGEALAIALTAISLGFIGAVTDMAIWAILGALLVGVAVGVVQKQFWPTVLGAPIGAFSGALLWSLLRFFGVELSGMVILASVLAVIGALVGRLPGGVKSNRWERFRPILGALGAMLFVLIGIVIGEGLQWLLLYFSN